MYLVEKLKGPAENIHGEKRLKLQKAPKIELESPFPYLLDLKFRKLSFQLEVRVFNESH